MSSERKTRANRTNSRKSSGPRTAAGRAKASRNALRHGLTAIVHRQPVAAGEIDRLAKHICGDDDNPALLAPARAIAEHEYVLRAIRAQQVAVIGRLREKTAIPLVKGDNTLALAKERFRQTKRAYKELVTLLPGVLAKYQDELPSGWQARPSCDLVPLALQCLLEKSEDEATAPDHSVVEERSEFEALEQALPDLRRLQRYERQVWLRQQRALWEFMKNKVTMAWKIS